MNERRSWMNTVKNLMATIWMLCASAILLSSCAHVTPTINESETIASEGNNRTAGVISKFADQSFEVSARWRESFNLLVEDFGTKTWNGHTTKDLGLTELANGNWRATKEAMEREYEMRLIRDDDQIHRAGTLMNKIR